MIKLLANTATALSLMLSASVGTPAWSADKSHAKCHHKAKQVKRTVVPQPNRGVMVVEKRKLDVQILSFGP